MKKIFTTILAVILLATCALSAASCSASEIYSEGEGELKVLCTIFAPFDFARKVGGNKVTVSILQDSGADLHNYSVTTKTLDALMNSDVFIYIGGESDEAWVEDAIAACGNEKLITVCLMDYITPMHAELENDWSECDEHEHDHDVHEDAEHEGHEHHGDEHIWNSLKNAKLMVEAIRSVFVGADSENALVYNENAANYTSRLDQLDKQLEQAVSSAKNNVIVFADRFPFVYLMHDYSIPYIAAFSGCSTEVNASFETQIKLINAVQSNSLTCVVTIEGGNKSLAEAIQLETDCKILEINSMQSIKRADIQNGADYIEIMKQNISVIKEALE